MDRARFMALWQRNLSGQARCDAEAAFAELEGRYAEPCRRYHNGEHIAQVLSWFDRYRDQADEPDLVELSIWFHDACYGPDPTNHEARSAQLFLEMSEGGMADDRRQRVVELIKTTTHTTAPASKDAALVVDADLSSFARPWHAFIKDTARCRAEKPMNDDQFCACQLGFLRTLQAREWIYCSAPFRRHHEADARRNISRLITLLEKRKRRLQVMSNSTP